jgi:hypothetical protein
MKIAFFLIQFEVFTAVKMWIVVLNVMAPYRFGGAYHLHLQGGRFIVNKYYVYLT